MHNKVKRRLETTLLLMTVVSGWLVGISVGSVPLTVIAVAGAVLAYFLTDRWRLFRLEGWLANIASVAVLYLVFRDFDGGDQAQKLVAVARLLVYLQTILMFQPKTGRLIWQVMVLSLLQVVIAAIFTLDFEASFLFLLYFVIAGTGMMLQTIYGPLNRIEKANRRASEQRRLNQVDAAEPGLSSLNGGHAVSLEPIVFFELPPRRPAMLRGRLFQFGMWLTVSAVFATLAFCVLPRSGQPWYGPSVHQVTTAGMLTAVDLDQRGKIRLSKELVFRASFEDIRTSEPLTNLASPYFRAMAFSQVTIKDNRTSFTAPFDRVYPDVYQTIPRFRGKGRRVRQVTTLEKTTDPLVYEVMPVFRTSRTPEELEFCHEISTYTRCREKEEISIAPYKYETGTLVWQDGRFLDSWPYVSNTHKYQQQPLSFDPNQREWLTQMDRSRYPGLVRAADKLAAEVGDVSRAVLIHKFANYFQQSNRYRYTLDFSDTKWNDQLDPIEDFFSYQRSGHCELYAAALTMMLRSQGIPARLVVGFHGSEFNSVTKSFFVRGTHAHAWVEAYLRPDDCTAQMLHDGAAGPGGAWKILDPTPLGGASERIANRGSAIELARTVWQDYVLGMEGKSQADGPLFVSPTLIRMFQAIDANEIEDKFQRIRSLATAPWLRNLVVVFVLLAILLRILGRAMLSVVLSKWKARNGGRGLRSIVAEAIGLISPRIGDWLRTAGVNRNSTDFYNRMSSLLAKQGMVRLENQTHRHFAQQVGEELSQHPDATMIVSIVSDLTEQFNAIRFGSHAPDANTRLVHGQQLQRLESALAEHSNDQNLAIN